MKPVTRVEINVSQYVSEHTRNRIVVAAAGIAVTTIVVVITITECGVRGRAIWCIGMSSRHPGRVS